MSFVDFTVDSECNAVESDGHQLNISDKKKGALI